MSSCPGLTLEDFLAWQYDLVVEDQDEANISLGLAEALGTAVTRRQVLTQKEFAVIVQLFEEHREGIEDKLLDYDEEDHGSWRTYACYGFDAFVTDELNEQVQSYLNQLKETTKGDSVEEATQVVEVTEVKSDINTSIITKELALTVFKDVRIAQNQAALPVRNLCDAVALLSRKVVYVDIGEEAEVQEHINRVLNGALAATTVPVVDYVSGNGPVAAHLKKTVGALDYLYMGRNPTVEAMLREIDQKFNLNPIMKLDSLEWKNIIQTFIELQEKYVSEDISTFPVNVIDDSTAITESGIYQGSDGVRYLYLVFVLNNVTITVIISKDKDPMIQLFHEWENTLVNIYNVCYFPGMFKAIIGEIEKLPQ